MDETSWWIIDIIGPAILLIILVWLVMRRRSNRSERELSQGTGDGTEAATRDLYAEEEQRRREGTDDL